MIEIKTKEMYLHEKVIYGQMLISDHGIQAFIGGGDLAHIGASTIIHPEGKKQTILFPGHKEDVITEKWAETIYEKYNVPVVVSAGIHFDGITKAEIMEVLQVSEEILRDIVS